MMRTIFVYLVISAIGILCQENNDDGLYHPQKYLGNDGNDGQYIHDNSGQYIHDASGQYKPDRSGDYKGDASGFYRRQLNKFRGGDDTFNGGTTFGRGAPNRGRFSNFIGRNNFRRLDDDFDTGFSDDKDSFPKLPPPSPFKRVNYQEDQYQSSTFAPVGKILHRKPLEGIKDVELLRNPSRNFQKAQQSNDFFGDSASGTSFDAKTTHSAFRTYPAKYNQGRYDDSRWRILKQNGDVSSDGYHWDFETENGIIAEETGKVANKGSDLEAMRAKGSFKYTGPDNKVYSVSYTADENGFIAKGNHLPTPPPIPDEILKSLNYQRPATQRGKF